MLTCGILLAVFLGVAASEGKTPPGQGEWEISFYTTKAEGDGCGFDWLDVQLDDEIVTGLVISAVEGTDCSPGSTDCMYELHWKCAMYDTFDDSPETQQVPATISTDGKQATIVVPPYSSKLFMGTQDMQMQTIIATDESLTGSEKWKWVSSAEGANVCAGEDRISAIPQNYPCEGDWYDEDYMIYPGDEVPEGPVPEGMWVLRQDTKSADGVLCEEMGLEVGMKTQSAIIISKGYEDDGSLSDTKFDVFFRCSSDEALIDQIDDATATFEPGGNITLQVKRVEKMDYDDGIEDFYEYGGEGLTDEERSQLQDLADLYGTGSFTEGEEMDYTLVFCKDAKAEKGYRICDGSGSWHWWIQDDHCRGRDTFQGELGNCTNDMMGIQDLEGWNDDDEYWWYGGSGDYDDWWADPYEDEYGYGYGYGYDGDQDYEEESWWDRYFGYGGDEYDETALQREEEGTQELENGQLAADIPFWEHADLEEHAGGSIPAPKRDEDGNAAPRPIRPIIDPYGATEYSKEGYPIRQYKSPRKSRMGLLFVGVPLGSLFLGVAYILYRRYRPDLGGSYSRVNRA